MEQDKNGLAGVFRTLVPNRIICQAETERIAKLHNINIDDYNDSSFGGKNIPSDVEQCNRCGMYDVIDKRVVEVILLNNPTKTWAEAVHMIRCICVTDTKFKPSNLPYTGQDKTFESFKLRQGTENAVKGSNLFVERVVKGQPSVLVLIGTQGTGKTHLMSAIGQRLATHNIENRYELTAQMLDGMRQAITNPNSSIEEMMRFYQTYKVLMLDDIGMEKPTEWVIDRLQLMIDSRTVTGLGSLVVATNLNQDDLSSRLGARIGSRLWDKTSDRVIRVVMRATDYRLNG